MIDGERLLSMADVHDCLVVRPDLAKPGQAAAICAAIVRLGEIAGSHLSDIPASAGHVLTCFGPKRDRMLRRLIGSLDQVKIWRARILAGIDIVNDEAAARAERRQRQDAWTEPLRQAEDRIKGDDETRRLAAIGIEHFVDRARRDGLTPQTVSLLWVVSTHDAENDKGKRAAFRGGARAFQPLGVACPPTFQRRGAAASRSLAAHLAGFVEEQQIGRLYSEYTTEREGGVSEDMITQYVSGVRFMCRVLTASGDLAPDADPPVTWFAEPGRIWRVFSYQKKNLQNIAPITRATAIIYMSALLRFLRTVNPLIENERGRLKKYINKQFVEGDYAEIKREASRRMKHDLEFQEGLLRLPFVLHKRAEALLSGAAGRKPNAAAQREAMVLGGTAALLKLELLAPNRISEALALTCRGPCPSLILPDHEGMVIIDLPGEKTKTGRPYYVEIPEDEGDGLREMLCWYKTRIRPLVLTHSWGKASSELHEGFFPITRGRAYDWIRKVSRRDDLEINPHLLRSILATFLLTDGKSNADDAAGFLNIGRKTAIDNYIQEHREEIAARARSRNARRLKAIRLGTDEAPAP